MIKITRQKMADRLSERKGTTFVSCLTRTEPKATKKSRSDKTPFVDKYPSGVYRVAYGQFQLGCNYEDNVNAQREREGHPEAGEFKAEQLWGGKGKAIGRILITHVEKPGFYVRMRPKANDVGCPLKIEDRYETGDGTVLTDEEVAELKRDFLPALSKSSKQEVEKEIPYRVYKLSNITAMRIDGNTYQLV